MEKEIYKEDLRTVRTRKFLSNALLTLLEKHSIDEITIHDICEKAMVHRTTFYTHFNDKYDLFAYMLSKVREEIYEHTQHTTDFDTPKDMYMGIAREVIDFIEENRKQLTAILKNNSNEIVLSILYETIQASVLDLLELNKHKENFQVPLEVASSFYTGGFIALVIWWLKNYNKYKKDQLLAYCDILIDEKICTLCASHSV